MRRSRQAWSKAREVREPLDQLDTLLSTEEVAEYLGVGQATVYRWCRDESLPAVKIGRRWRVRRSALEEFVRKNERSETLVGRLRAFIEVPDNLLAVVQDRELMSKVDAAFFRTAEASGGRRRRSGGRGTLALRNGGRRAGQPGRKGAAAGRGGERRGPLRVDRHELGFAYGGQGGAAATAGLDRTGRGLGAGRQDNGAGGEP